MAPSFRLRLGVVLVVAVLCAPIVAASQSDDDVPAASTVPPKVLKQPVLPYAEPVEESVITTSSTDVRVSGDYEALAEVLIDVNPTNSDNLVICGHAATVGHMATYYSMDGGRTWTHVEVGDDQDHLGWVVRFDPALAFDGDGNVYVAYGASYHVGGAEHTSVVVCKSTDGGKTYSQTAFVWQQNRVLNVPGNDKWVLGTGRDPLVPDRQNVYIAWTWNIPAPGNLDQQIAVSRSFDGGATFTVPLVINDDSIIGRDRALTADPTVGPNGELYVSWHDFSLDSAIMIDRSFDAGETWGTDVVVATGVLPLKTSIPPQYDRGVSSGPVSDVDISGGPYNGRVYITYCHPGAFGYDILLRHSDDQAATWSAPKRVNDDPGLRIQFLPWLDVGRENGIVSVVFYDTREDSNDRLARVYAAVSRTGGESFEPNTAVADVPSNNSTTNPYRYPGNYLEYIGVATGPCAAYAVWSDTRRQWPVPVGGLEYYFDRIPFETNPPTVVCPPDLVIECDPTGTGVPVTDPRVVAFLNGCSASDDCDANVQVQYQTAITPLTKFPLGVTRVTFRATDDAGNVSEPCDAFVRVLGNTPPRIDVTLNRTVLWPPDHRMVGVHATVNVDDACTPAADIAWVLWSVTSNQPAEDAGDGDTEIDIAGANGFTRDLDFDLRAERSGSVTDRVYTVVYRASDGSAAAFDTAYVRVPHDSGWREPPTPEAVGSAPRETVLRDARPNPFNPSTAVTFELAREERVRLDIFDAHGRRVRTLLDERRPAGAHRVSWNGTGDSGEAVASGVYFLRMYAGDYSATRKLVLLK